MLRLARMLIVLPRYDDLLHTVPSERFRRRRIIEYEIDAPIGLPDMVQRAFENDSPFFDGDDVICDLLNFRNLMRREEYGGAVSGLLNQALQHLLGHYRIETFARLIEDKELRMAAQVEQKTQLRPHAL